MAGIPQPELAAVLDSIKKPDLADFKNTFKALRRFADKPGLDRNAWADKLEDFRTTKVPGLLQSAANTKPDPSRVALLDRFLGDEISRLRG